MRRAGKEDSGAVSSAAEEEKGSEVPLKHKPTFIVCNPPWGKRLENAGFENPAKEREGEEKGINGDGDRGERKGGNIEERTNSALDALGKFLASDKCQGAPAFVLLGGFVKDISVLWERGKEGRHLATVLTEGEDLKQIGDGKRKDEGVDEKEETKTEMEKDRLVRRILSLSVGGIRSSLIKVGEV